MKIVLDLETGKPMCALIQAAFGGDFSRLTGTIPSEYWILEPTDKMIACEFSEEELEKYSKCLGSKKAMEQIVQHINEHVDKRTNVW